MALTESFAIQRPGQTNSTGDIDAQHLEEYTGVVESTLERTQALVPHVPFRSVRGTSMITNFAVGKSTLQKVTPGQVLDGTQNDFSKKVLHVEVHIAARNIIPNIEVFQTEYDARKEIGEEHGKLLGKFKDQALSIQAIKAALATESAYSQGSAGKPGGHFGGSQQVLAAALDSQDPAKLYAAIAALLTKMELKDVNPRTEGVILVCKPDVMYTLGQAEQLINTNYVSATGNQVNNGFLLKAWGIPVVSTNNFVGGENIASHFLDTVNNGNAFSGDYTKVVMGAFSPKALLAGATLPLTTDVFYDKLSKSWFVDADEAYSATTNRHEFAGVILKP